MTYTEPRPRGLDPCGAPTPIAYLEQTVANLEVSAAAEDYAKKNGLDPGSFRGSSVRLGHKRAELEKRRAEDEEAARDRAGEGLFRAHRQREELRERLAAIDDELAGLNDRIAALGDDVALLRTRHLRWCDTPAGRNAKAGLNGARGHLPDDHFFVLNHVSIEQRQHILVLDDLLQKRMSAGIARDSIAVEIATVERQHPALEV